MNFRKYIFSATLLAFGACQSWAQTSFLNAWAVNNPPLRNDYGNFVGMKFTVGNANLTVSSVGRLCVQGNSGNHLVKFVNGSNNQDVVGGSATVAMAGCTANQFVYQALSSSVTLSANTTYYIASLETVGGDKWYDYGTVVSTADATVNSAIYFDGASWNPLALGSFSYVPPNFLYTGPPPPPPTFVQSVNTNATLRNDYSGFVGMQLTVGGTPLTVTQLGRICAASSSQSHTVKFVDSTGADVLGLSASVNMAGCTVGQYVYAPPSAAGTLQAGSTYYLVSQETAGGDKWYDFTSIATTGVAAVNHAAYTVGSQYITISSTNMSYVPPNFQYSTGGGACTISVTVGTNPSGLNFSVDGTTYNSNHTFPTWDCTKSHTIATTTPQPTTGATVEGFSSWSDGGGISHTVQPTSATTYTATFTQQYSLTTATSPAADGTISANPASSNGYYNAGTLVQLTALANSGYTFASFTVDGSTVTSNPVSVTMSAAHSVTANFTATGPAGATFVTSFSTATTVRNDFSGWVGMKILTGTSSIPLTAIGRACLSGNALTHTVKFVLASNSQDVPGATATVNMSGCTPGTFVYAPPQSTVSLQPNTAYLLVSQETAGSGQDTWYDLTVVTPNPVIPATVTNAVYSLGSSYITDGSANFSYVVPNFQTGPQAPPVMVTVNTSPSGLAFTVDGSSYTASATLSWVPGSSHTIATTSPQNSSGGTQQAFASWTDGGAISHTVTGPSTATTYTANFTTQYQLTTNVSPAGSGTVAVSPASASGFYNSGTTVQLTATAASGYTFQNWSGGASGSTNPLSVQITGVTSVTANFAANGVQQPNFIQTYTKTSLRTDFTGFVGMEITVGANPLNVSSVGRICAAANSTGGHIVKFVQVGSNADVTNGSAIVNMAGCTPGKFVYTPLSVVLQANSKYYLVSQETVGGDVWYDQGPVTSTSVATINGSAYQIGSNYIVNGAPNYSYVPPDFQYTVAPPPPPTFVTAYGSTGPALRSDFSGFVGMALTVASNSLTVSQLGRICVTGNSQTHMVEFVEASNPAIVVGSANVNMSGCTPGQFVYATPTGGTFVLSSGQSYYLASQEASGGDKWYDLAPISTTTVANVTSAVYQQGANWITNGGSNESYVPPNFIYASGNTPLLTVYPSRAPNAFGSPSFAGWSANAITALENSQTSIGTPGTDPTAYFQVAQETNYQNIVSSFNSWLGLAPPGTTPFASELGNRLHYGLHILGNGSKFSLSQLSFDLESDDAGNSFSQTGDFSTNNYSAQIVGIIHNGNSPTMITSGAGTQMVDELVYVGIGAAIEPADVNCASGTNQAQLNCVAAFYAGISPFNLKITYSLNGISGAGSVHFVSGGAAGASAITTPPSGLQTSTLSPATTQAAGKSSTFVKPTLHLYK